MSSVGASSACATKEQWLEEAEEDDNRDEDHDEVDMTGHNGDGEGDRIVVDEDEDFGVVNDKEEQCITMERIPAI
ncbi:hypothetical protein ACLOJK_013693 [Asimina triloba]